MVEGYYKEPDMIFNYYSKMKVVRALCEDTGLTIQFTNEDAPRTNGRILYIPRPSPEWTPQEFLLWEYKIYHESGHCDPAMNDIFTVCKDKGINMGSFFGYCWNLLDDHRQEYHKHDLYEGKRKVMSQGRGLFLDSQVKASTAEPCASTEAAIGKALFAWDSYKRVDFQPECVPAALAFIDKLDPVALDYYNKLLESGDRFVTRNTTALEEYEIVKELLEYLGCDSNAEEEKAKGEGEPSEGDDGESSGKGEPCESTKYLFHKHDEDGDMKAGSEYGMGKDTDGVYVPTPEVRIVRDFKVYNRVTVTKNSIGKAVRKLIQVRSQSHYQQGLKKGKLGRNLHRTCIPDSGAYGERVFKQKIEATTKDTSIMVLVDCSGSMQGNKYTCAINACALLNDALAVTGVKYSIVGFTYSARKPKHFIFKDFNSRVSSDEVASRMESVYLELADNADGESLLWAHSEMLKQKTTKKMIIALSDGSPAASGTKGLSSFTKRVCKTIEADSRVALYGIGIEDSSVNMYYKNCEVIHNASELEGALLNVIKNRVLS